VYGVTNRLWRIMWEPSPRYWAVQDTFRLLWNPTSHYHVHKATHLDLIRASVIHSASLHSFSWRSTRDIPLLPVCAFMAWYRANCTLSGMYALFQVARSNLFFLSELRIGFLSTWISCTFLSFISSDGAFDGTCEWFDNECTLCMPWQTVDARRRFTARGY
jgi:hypothetical protein